MPGIAAIAGGLWDYIIVGGGTAGCVLANRLSADGRARVLLIEAGGSKEHPDVAVPQKWPFLSGGVHDWAYRTVPQRGLNGRIIAQPRGKGLGGSSLINAMGFQRGAAAIYDMWAEATGDPGWGAEGMRGWFRKLETAAGGGDEWRGDEGPYQVLSVGSHPQRSDYAAACVAAGEAAGFAFNADWNGASDDGTIWTQLAMAHGKRVTARNAYLDPVLGRANLTVLPDTATERVIVKEGQATGVVIRHADRLHTIRATGEIILAAGAIDSPKLLMLSGIGDPAALLAHGIAPHMALQGVGQGLVDHPLVPATLYATRRDIPGSAFNHCECLIVTNSSQSGGLADIQLMFLAIPRVAEGFGAPPARSVTVLPALIDPRSRGSLQLASPDPLDPPLIDPGYLSDDTDVAILVESFAMVRKVMTDPALSGWIGQELVPGPDAGPEALEEIVRVTAEPFYHPASTCRMGRADDPDAVVDPRCKVIGVDGLRVVDASVFPKLPNAMPVAAVLATAEKASAIILEDR